MSKFYLVNLSARTYASTTVVVEVDDDQLDEDGQPIDDFYIEDMAVQQAYDGNVVWEYEGVDDDSIEVGTISRTWVRE